MKFNATLLLVWLLAGAVNTHAQVPTVHRVAADFRQCDVQSVAVGPDGSVFSVIVSNAGATVKRHTAAGTEVWATDLDPTSVDLTRTQEIYAHEFGVDVFALRSYEGDTVDVLQFSLSGEFERVVTLADGAAGRVLSKGMYADKFGYIILRASKATFKEDIVSIYDRNGVPTKREQTMRLSTGTPAIYRSGETVIVGRLEYVYFTSMQPGAKSFYLTPMDLRLDSPGFRGLVPRPRGFQFFASGPGAETSTRFAVDYDGTDYSVTTEASAFPGRAYEAFPWGLDSLVNLSSDPTGFTFEVRSLGGALGRVVETNLSSISVAGLSNRSYPGAKGIYTTSITESIGGTQSSVRSYVPAGATFELCDPVIDPAAIDYPIVQTLQLADGSVLASQVGRPGVVQVRPDGMKEPYFNLGDVPKDATIHSLISAGASDNHISCAVPYNLPSGAPGTSILTIKDGRVISRSDLLGLLMYARKLEPWEGGGRVFYLNRQRGEETIYLMDSLGAIIKEIEVSPASRVSDAYTLFEVSDLSFDPNGNYVMITIEFNNSVGGVEYVVEARKDGEVLNSYRRKFVNGAAARGARFAPDGSLLLGTSGQSEGGRDSLRVIPNPGDSFRSSAEWALPNIAYPSGFRVLGRQVLFKASSFDASQPSTATIGTLTFDLDSGRAIDSALVSYPTQSFRRLSSMRNGSIRPGLAAYPVELNNSKYSNAIAMIGTKSSAVRDRRSPNVLTAVTNPFTDAIYFSTPVLPKGVTLSDALGRNHALTPVTELADGRYVTQPLQSLPAGVYVLNVDGSSRVLIHQ